MIIHAIHFPYGSVITGVMQMRNRRRYNASSSLCDMGLISNNDIQTGISTSMWYQFGSGGPGWGGGGSLLPENLNILNVKIIPKS